MRRVLLTGATGFVGKRAYPALRAAGWEVRSASRHAEASARKYPDREWIRFDVENAETVAHAVAGMNAILYLVHAMGQGGDFETKERAAARTLVREAERAGVQRIVYLGGVAPAGEPSKHLRSRLATGELLRQSSIATIELRAGMIVGAGGLSWHIVRDLAARLPFMVLPRWLRNRSQPVAIDDVVHALVRALELPPDVRGVFDLPGPETLSGDEILTRIAHLLGTEPRMLRVPVLTPKLSSYWLKLVTRADFAVAQELIEGLTSDLIASNRSFWEFLPDRAPTPFDTAARAALAEDARQLPAGARALERLLQHLSRRASA